MNNNNLSWRELTKNMEMILNNKIINYEVEYWELFTGNDYDEEIDEYVDIYQYYIITAYDADIFKDINDYLDNDFIVYYNENLDIYLLGVTHYGTSWNSVNSGVPENYASLIYEKKYNR